MHDMRSPNRFNYGRRCDKHFLTGSKWKQIPTNSEKVGGEKRDKEDSRKLYSFITVAGVV